MKRPSTRTILAFITLLTLATAALVFIPRLQQEWTQPLGPALGMPTLTPTLVTALPTATSAVAQGTLTGEAASSLNQPQTTQTNVLPSPSPTAETYCGGPPVMFLLGVGADSGQDYRYGLADVIRVARIDFTIPRVTMLAMPRDLWVEIPEINTKYDITHGKLNQAYFYGGPGMGYYTGPGGAPGLLARTLDLNFGLRVDHYGAVNMQTFVKIVDAVGGIDIYLPTAVDGRSDNGGTIDLGYFPAGQHHFNGEEALRFARIRKLYNDFTRQDHQNMVICALQARLREPAVIASVPKIIAAFQDSVQTDLSPQQISQFACLLPYLKRENIIFTGLPEEILSPGRVYNERQKNTTFVMEADYEVIRDYVAQFITGTWPTQPDEPTCP